MTPETRTYTDVNSINTTHAIRYTLPSTWRNSWNTWAVVATGLGSSNATFVLYLNGAAIITLLPEVLRTTGITAGAVRLGINGLILLLVILFLPNGLLTIFTGRRRLAPA